MKIQWVHPHAPLLLFFVVGGSVCEGFAPIKSSTLRFQSPTASDDVVQDPSPTLTVLLPAYNEANRIGDTLQLYQQFLVDQWHHECYCDILVVDDGSIDSTVEVVQSLSSNLNPAVPISCLSLPSNQGKGAAIAAGIRSVAHNSYEESSSLILIADADASADIACFPALYSKLQHLCDSENTTTTGTAAIVVGKRTYADPLPPDRMILRWGFRTAVRLLCGDLGVSDTQCGFKLLTLSAATLLYSNLHLKGWSHDVEVLYRAKEVFGILVAEEAVPWQDKEGSKLVTSPGGTIGVSLQMLSEIAQLRLFYTTRIWTALQERKQ